MTINKSRPAGIERREFLKWGTAASLYFSYPGTRLFGQEALTPEMLYAKYVPGEKGLDPDWINSLTTRQHALDEAIAYDVNQEVNLGIVGMTVGGIACGTVYLSGDGRLWIWDIFNQHHEGVVANTAEIPKGLQTIQRHKVIRERDGANFLLPPHADQYSNGVDLKFSLTIKGQAPRTMDARGWSEVAFEGRWPIGTVRYRDAGSPVVVDLQVFSPFIPLNLEESSLPLTVIEYTFRNTSSEAVNFNFSGSLNNALGQFSGHERFRANRAINGAGWIGFQHELRQDESGKDGKVAKALDGGSMALACIGDEAVVNAVDPGTVDVSTELKAGEKKTIRFVVAWHLPNLHPKHGCGEQRRHYAARFDDASAVVRHFAENDDQLCGETRNWVATWNDSTLPQWLLDRTILPTNTLQTQCCLIFEDGRFWAWEGIGCCPGTCGHVWQYAQGHARLFPEIERNLREVTDFGLAQQPNGEIVFRGTNNKKSATDAQCAYVLRTLRDHQLSDDPDYLRRVWPHAKKALDYLIQFDQADQRGGLDGLLDGKQHNTLDAKWYGKVHVLCSMYLAALRAGEEMAKTMGDDAYASEVRGIYEKGRKNIETLFNGEYYEQIEDPDHLKAIGVGKGCYIDQIMGQFWAFQVGLGRLYQPERQKAALRALWTYNFVPEYGQFRQAFPQGRHYATAGDAGLLMCTWPKGGLREDFKKHWQYAYFNEFMTGFEYQVASHMIAEGEPDLVEKGLAITRAIHDRYSAKRGRNPYNEIECSDHYARAGSAYAVFLAVCGFQFDQARGRLAFDPVIQQDFFRAPFTTSQAWGTYEQGKEKASIAITHGTLILNELEIGIFKGHSPSARLNGKAVTIANLTLKKGDVLELSSV